jgi:hypothetical protein
MPKKLLVEFTCSRCPRVWYEPYDPEGEEPKSYSFIATLKHPLGDKPSREVIFESLCERCAATVLNYIDHIGKVQKHKSPEPGAKRKPPKAAPSRKGKKS